MYYIAELAKDVGGGCLSDYKLVCWEIIVSAISGHGKYRQAILHCLGGLGTPRDKQYRGCARQKHRADAVEETFSFGVIEPAPQVQPNQCIPS